MKRELGKGRTESGEQQSVRTSLNCPISVDFLPAEILPLSGRLGLTLAPGKKTWSEFGPPWDRDLATDLERLHAVYGTQTLVCLLEKQEMVDLHIPDLAGRAETMDIRVLRYPVRDGQVPDEAQIYAYREVIGDTLSAVRMGESVVVHCRGGLGRAGTFSACCLIEATGTSPEDAIRAVRDARPGAIENGVQEGFVARYADLAP